MLITGCPDFDPPRTTQGESLSNDIEHEDKYPEGSTSGRFEIGHVDTSLNTARFTCLIFDELFRLGFVWNCAVGFPV